MTHRDAAENLTKGQEHASQRGERSDEDHTERDRWVEEPTADPEEDPCVDSERKAEREGNVQPVRELYHSDYGDWGDCAQVGGVHSAGLGSILALGRCARDVGVRDEGDAECQSPRSPIVRERPNSLGSPQSEDHEQDGPDVFSDHGDEVCNHQ